VISHFQPFFDDLLFFNIIEDLAVVPCQPILASFRMIAVFASRNAIACSILPTFCLWLDMIKRQAFVVNWRIAAISAAVIPSVFNGLTPQAFSFFISHCLKIVKVIFGSLTSRNCLGDH